MAALGNLQGSLSFLIGQLPGEILFVPGSHGCPDFAVVAEFMLSR